VEELSASVHIIIVRRTVSSLKIEKGLRDLYGFKWFKISTAIFLGGFFIGYNLGFLDFVPTPIPFQYLVPYLAKVMSSAYYPGSVPQIDKLDYVKYTFAEAVVVLGGGVLIGLVTVGALFILGLSVGASLPSILEYAGASAASQSIVFAFLFACAMIFLGTSGLSLGSSILHLAKNTAFKIDRRTYDAFLLGLAFLILSILMELF